MTTQQRSRPRGAVARGRAGAAYLLWWACVACAVLLASGALLVALRADPDQRLIAAVLAAADVVDLGLFDRDGGVWEFTGGDAAMRTALFNWGLGALAWLALGRLVDRLVGP